MSSSTAKGISTPRMFSTLLIVIELKMEDDMKEWEPRKEEKYNEKRYCRKDEMN